MWGVAMDEELKQLIIKYADKYGLDPKIVYGVCMQESGLNPLACRYEPKYKWLWNPSKSKPKTCSLDTEIILQKTSWGLMQDMGAVFRELGFTGWLTEVIQSPEVQIDYGCCLLAKKIQKYGLVEGILSYNSGSPLRKKGGGYVNEDYLKGVMQYSEDFEP